MEVVFISKRLGHRKPLHKRIIIIIIIMACI